MSVIKAAAVIFILVAAGCEPAVKSIIETAEGHQVREGTSLSVILQVPLSSNQNSRGDTFTTVLKSPLALKGKIILPENTELRGLVKRVVKFEKFGDKAGLLLLFDQIVMPDGRKLPIEAGLDTDKGGAAIKIKGKKTKDIGTVGSSAIVGTLVGSKVPGKDSAKKGLVVGATVGAGVVILSDMMEVKLPEGTEFTIRLKETLFIPAVNKSATIQP
ncbi:hypothetical protein H8E50_07230 [bacterium]|nr:hypothetical protein [bacterium]